MVYRNLVRAGHTDPWMNKLVGLHRYHWIQNASAQQRLLEIASALNSGGLEFVAVGGLALWAGRYIDDLGERPMLDGEFLVSNADAPRVRQTLTSLGWRTATNTLPPIAGWQSEWWRSAGRPLVRINYRWLPKPYPGVAARTACWPTPRRRRFQACRCGFPTRRISCSTPALAVASDGLTTHIARFGLPTRFCILQRSGSRIDWHRFYRDASLLRCEATLETSLIYLARNFAIELPTRTSLTPRIADQIGQPRPVQFGPGWSRARLSHGPGEIMSPQSKQRDANHRPPPGCNIGVGGCDANWFVPFSDRRTSTVTHHR